MYDRQPFHQFVPHRVDRAIKRLKEQIYHVEGDPLRVLQTKATREHRPVSDAKSLTFTEVKKTPRAWGNLFDQCFWTIDLRGRETKGRFLKWDDLGEATVFLDEMPIFGFDPGHHVQKLPNIKGGINELLVESICCRSGVWVPGENRHMTAEGSIFHSATLLTRDEKAFALMHDLDTLLQTVLLMIRRDRNGEFDMFGGSYREHFDSLTPLARRMLVLLSDIVAAYEKDGIAAACKVSARAYKELHGRGEPDAEIILTGHAHIDLVWLWPETTADFKAVHSLSNALSLMDRYPEFVFGYSQPASYDAIESRAPKLMKEVGRRIKSGQFEHAGCLYVESDTQLPCGENLLRSFEIGQLECMRRFGERSKVLWLPDVFGYSNCIPQLMNQFGVEYFYTTKQHWSNYTLFPHSSFVWEGQDGSEALAHVSFMHYNLEATPDQIRFTADHHRQAGIHSKALMPTGYGDGGGATNEDMCERAQRLQSLAGMPKTKWGRIDEFFESMARVRANLPKWRGEIYMETHRGVQTTQSRLKETFRQAERALQTLEAAHAVAGLGEIDEQLWKRLVFVQFHDNIPGSSIPRVYRETIPELEAMTKQASKQASEALGGKGNTHLFNPLAMPMVASHKGKTVFLPALSAINIKEVDAIVDTVNAGKSSISNGRVKASFNTKGEISKLIIDGCKVEHREPLGQLFIFPDHPINFDAWDIDRDTLSLGTRCTTPTTVESGSDTTSAWTSFSRSIAQQSTITTRYEVRIGESVLRITYHLDWQDTQTLLKVAMPTRYQGENVRYGAPFGSTLRPQKQGTIAAEAMFEVPASRWAVVCDDTESQGLAMITESKFGFGCRDGLLHCSLNRSARHTQPHVAGTTTSLDLSEVPDEFTDIGEQVIRIALTSYEASTPREHQPAALAETLFAEPVLVKGTAINTPIINIEGLHSIIPTWVKPMSDGSMLLRVNETLGKRGSITIYLANGWEAIESDVMGEATRQEFSRGKLTVKMKPYQLKTVRIRT